MTDSDIPPNVLGRVAVPFNDGEHQFYHSSRSGTLYVAIALVLGAGYATVLGASFLRAEVKRGDRIEAALLLERAERAQFCDLALRGGSDSGQLTDLVVSYCGRE